MYIRVTRVLDGENLRPLQGAAAKSRKRCDQGWVGKDSALSTRRVTRWLSTTGKRVAVAIVILHHRRRGRQVD